MNNQAEADALLNANATTAAAHDNDTTDDDCSAQGASSSRGSGAPGVAPSGGSDALQVPPSGGAPHLTTLTGLQHRASPLAPPPKLQQDAQAAKAAATTISWGSPDALPLCART